MSSTDLYHRATKQRGVKFNQSMTRGKLLDNNTTLFIFYFYSNDDPRDPENRRQNQFSERRFSEQTSYNRLNGKVWLTAVLRLSANILTLVSVDLIGEKNKVILEFTIILQTNWVIHTYVRYFLMVLQIQNPQSY